MKINPLAAVPLFLALLALVVSTMAVGTPFYLIVVIVGLAVATALVAIATLFQYTRSSTEAKQVPVENFSLWADVGEPAAELKRMGYENVEAALKIAAADLGSLAANAELLAARLAMLMDREGFGELTSSRINRDVQGIASGINSLVERMKKADGFSADDISPLEGYASTADRVANKLFEFEKGKSEIVHIYVDPLRRASEKLSRDIRVAYGNIKNFISSKPPQ
ncbi:MAG: hypothetical protein QXG10_01960 [Candidatus Hadarchaeales archaeon]